MPNTKYLKMRRELEKIITQIFIQESRIDQKKIFNEIKKHGLVDRKTELPNPESWDNPEAGSFDVPDFIRKVSEAILSAGYIKKEQENA